MKYTKPILSVLFILLFLLPSDGLSQSANSKIEQVENSLSPAVKVKGEPLWTLEERMKHYNTPGISIAVIDNYQVDWAKAYGWADAKEKIPLTVSTPLQSASISKTINAVGILKLVESGKLDLSKDINEYLRSWKFPYSKESNSKAITLLHLLSHTAGLSTSGFDGYPKANKLPSLIQILDGKKPANSDAVRSRTEPGQSFRYSGGGIVITQLMIEDLTQKSYESYIQESILQALGMSNSFYTIPKDLKTEVAAGHWANGERLKRKYHYYPEQAPAGLWATPLDLSLLIIELQKALDGKSDKLLTQETAALMMKPALENNPSALGTFIDNKQGALYFQHSGSNEGFKCQYYGSMEGGKGVIIMTNGENFNLIPEVLRSVATVYNWKNFVSDKVRTIAKVEEADLKKYDGTYHFNLESALRIQHEGDQLFLFTSSGNKIELYPESPDFFFMRVVDEQVEFTEEDGEWVLNLHQNGAIHKAKKIK